VRLADYLDGLGPRLWRVAEPLSVVHEVTALQHALSEAGRYPALLVERPRLADLVRRGIPGVGIGGTDLFEVRTRVQAAARFV